MMSMLYVCMYMNDNNNNNYYEEGIDMRDFLLLYHLRFYDII